MVLLELVSCEIPYAETTDNWIVLRQIIEGARPRIPDEVPGQFAEMIRRCWEVDPAKRPSFEEMLPIFQQLDIHGPQLEIKSEV